MTVQSATRCRSRAFRQAQEDFDVRQVNPASRMRITLKTTVHSLACSCASVLAVFGQEPEAPLPYPWPHARESLEGRIHFGWESRYFTEGRDFLDGDSLFVGSFEMERELLAGGVWYGYSPARRYDELQLSLGLAQSVGDFDFYGSYTHLRFPYDGSHDNEIGAGAAWSGLPLDVGLSAGIYYSFESEGYFAEASAVREFPITDDLTLILSVPFGINQGYVADGHDGANHIAMRLGLEFALTDRISVTAHTTYSWALDRDSAFSGDAELVDFFHGGLGLQWSF